MSENLYYTTVNPLLLLMLRKLMDAKEFAAFRLVGGTSLSLQRGHRKSVDIDIFTDSKYGSVNFTAIETFLQDAYPYVSTNEGEGIGKAYYAGEREDHCIKVDIYYTDAFISPELIRDDIRLARIEDIIAMKLDVISRGGRKKDFWDIHELMEEYPAEKMFALHKKRYPHTHEPRLLKKMFTDFTQADKDFDPECLRGKHWEVIKLDMIDFSH